MKLFLLLGAMGLYLLVAWIVARFCGVNTARRRENAVDGAEPGMRVSPMRPSQHQSPVRPHAHERSA